MKRVINRQNGARTHGVKSANVDAKALADELRRAFDAIRSNGGHKKK